MSDPFFDTALATSFNGGPWLFYQPVSSKYNKLCIHSFVPEIVVALLWCHWLPDSPHWRHEGPFPTLAAWVSKSWGNNHNLSLSPFSLSLSLSHTHTHTHSFSLSLPIPQSGISSYCKKRQSVACIYGLCLMLQTVNLWYSPPPSWGVEVNG